MSLRLSGGAAAEDDGMTIPGTQSFYAEADLLGTAIVRALHETDDTVDRRGSGIVLPLVDEAVQRFPDDLRYTFLISVIRALAEWDRAALTVIEDLTADTMNEATVASLLDNRERVALRDEHRT
ncbi:hypothetical protein [Streptomyces sp. AP-93]|uniref:hypothetical protein n=1 Tax=Streptomyces sp. AP-93 TaxID=2929048 RepID=UPI001FAFCE93|nr:hypothetical protein [Streptomyces sp. AP-93]MCJ0868120.1 hypothetical protein [Streptomyces sp. AP-93]